MVIPATPFTVLCRKPRREAQKRELVQAPASHIVGKNTHLCGYNLVHILRSMGARQLRNPLAAARPDTSAWGKTEPVWKATVAS